MNSALIGVLTMLGLLLAASMLGLCLAKKKEGLAVLYGMLAAAFFGTTGYNLSMPTSAKASKYLQMGESVMAVATFSELDSAGHYVDKVAAKIKESYLVLELPPLADFVLSEKAYRVDHRWNQRAGFLKVEKFPNEFGPTVIMVTFEQVKENPNTHRRNVDKN